MSSECRTSLAVRPSGSILRLAPILRTEAGVSTSSKTLRAEQSLVARAFHAAQSANARRILLVSAHTGDGKTQFCRCILRHAGVVTDEPFEVASFTTLRPQREIEYGYLWVDGVSLLEGEGAAALTPAVRASFDGALLVARGMVTTRADVANCADQLRMLGMRLLGGVWNEFECPPPAETLHDIKAGLWKWPPPFPARVATRQTHRSS